MQGWLIDRYYLCYMFCAVSLMLVPPVMAGGVKAEMNQVTGSLDDDYVYTLVVEGRVDGDDITFPSIEGLRVLRAGTSTQVSIINFRRSEQTVLRFRIVPERAGSFVIPSLSFPVEGEQQSTPEFRLAIRDEARSSVGPAPNSSQSPQQGTSGSSGPSGKSKPQNETGSLPYIFMQRELTNRSPFVGEAVLSTVRLYYRVRLNDSPRLSPSQKPSFRTFSGDDRAIRQYRTRVDGQRFDVLEYTEILVPLEAGAQSLGRERMEVIFVPPSSRQDPGRRRSLFDMFDQNFVRPKQERLSTDEDILQVRALPKTRASGFPVENPDLFGGVVGEVQMETALSKTELKVGETSTLQISLSASTPLDDVKPLVWEPPAGIKVYRDRPESTVRVVGEGSEQGGQITSTYKVSIALVPTRSGRFNLGSLTWYTFDPTSGSYRRTVKDLGMLFVEQNAQAGAQASAPSATAASQEPGSSRDLSVQKSKVAVLARDLIDIERDPARLLRIDGLSPARTRFWMSLVGVSFVVWCLVMLGVSLAGRTGLRGRAWQKKAFARFEQRLAAESVAEAGAHAVLAQVQTYFAEKLGLEDQVISVKDIRVRLEELSVSEQDRQRVQALLDELERASFSTSAQLGSTGLSASDLQQRARECLGRFDPEWRV